jgi:hypothetical protein
MTNERVLDSQVRSLSDIHPSSSTHALYFSQRPVWKEQWCARKDAVESSGGKEDQFWATGISESLPPPSLPQSGHLRSHSADHDRPQGTYSNHPILAPSSSASTTRQGRMGMDHANLLPTLLSRRKLISNSSHPRSQPPPPVRIPKAHAHIPNRDFVRPMRSAGPYSSAVSMTSDGRIHKRSRREEEKSPFSGEWSQLKARSGSSMNPIYDFEQPFDDSLVFPSRSKPKMPAITSSYPTRYRVASADSPMSAGRTLFSSPVSSRRGELSSMHLDYAGSEGHSHPVNASSRSVQKREQHGASFASGDVSYGGFWPYAPSAPHENEPFTWSGDQGSQQMNFSPTEHSAPPPAYSNMLPPPDAQAHDFSFGQYAQSSSQEFPMLLSNEHSPSFSLNNDLYGSSEGFNAAHQFPDLSVMPTTQPAIDGMALQSFPNIVEDEDGMFRIE